MHGERFRAENVSDIHLKSIDVTPANKLILTSKFAKNGHKFPLIEPKRGSKYQENPSFSVNNSLDKSS